MMPATASDAPARWAARFATLGDAFGTPLAPRPLPAPYWVDQNMALARQLGLSGAWMASDEALATFSGNRVPEGSAPLASVYSGHQFGVWAGQLGDGRAILLGKVDTPAGPKLDTTGISSSGSPAAIVSPRAMRLIPSSSFVRVSGE